MSEEDARGATVADVARFVNEWARSMGITPESERPYLGNRCGWYPEKPKRRRKG